MEFHAKMHTDWCKRMPCGRGRKVWTSISLCWPTRKSREKFLASRSSAPLICHGNCRMLTRSSPAFSEAKARVARSYPGARSLRAPGTAAANRGWTQFIQPRRPEEVAGAVPRCAPSTHASSPQALAPKELTRWLDRKVSSIGSEVIYDNGYRNKEARLSENCGCAAGGRIAERDAFRRSEEHTSELQSLRHLVCRLLL